MPKNRDISPAAMSTEESSLATDRPLPRAKSAVFPVADPNANRPPTMSLGMLASALSTDGQLGLCAASTPNSSFSQIGSSEMGRQNDFLGGGGSGDGRGVVPPPPLSGSCSHSHLPTIHHHHYHQPAPAGGGAQQQQPHRRRSSIILNKRAPARQTESMELGERTGSKLTLDEELYDIIYAFLEVDRDKEEDEEATGTAAGGGKPLTRQNLLNKIREKKEVINKLRCQAWNMNRKRRTLRLAQKYLEQNESKVSKTHLYKEELVKRWRQFLRWLGNIWIYFVPWESRIKRIESQFGSVVSSYFTFLRWVIFINFAITIVILAFIVVPECIADAMADPARQNRTAGRKRIPPEELPHADELAVVWHFDGYLRFSPLFYGFYSNDPFISETIRYPLPLAYFLATLFVFLFSLIVIPRRIARNARVSKLSGTKAEQYVFNWKLFTGWDYSIGNAETATNAAMAAVIKLREAINESRSYARKACVPSLWAVRVITNTVILGMIALSVYCIQAAMGSSTTVEKSSGSLFTKNQVPLLMSTITHIFPMIFDLIGRAEKHHARTALRLHLIRISALYIINYVTLMLSLFEKLDKIRDISRQHEEHGEEGEQQIGGAAEKWQWRESGHKHAFRPQPDRPFLSRNFSTPHQLGQFFMRALQMESKQNRRSVDEEEEDNDDDQTTTSTQSSTNGKKSTGRVMVDGSSMTVHAQFGPVGVNNPSALMRNSTLPPLLESSPYETRRIGPTPLAVFTPPPLPPTPRVPTFRGQNFGPDWMAIQREREKKERARKKPPPTPAPTPANITVERPIDGLPYAKMETSTTTTTAPTTTTRRREEEQKVEKKGQTATAAPRPPELPPLSTTTTTISSSTSGELSTSTRLVEGDEDEDEDEAKYDDQICWETMIGQEIVKLVTMDLYITIVSIFLIDFLRGCWIRYCSSWWCWDIETTFPEYGEFKVAENVLHICNNQGMVWLGLFFAPLLPAINSVKLMVIMYIRGWACTTCNVPAREIFRASRSSSFFLYILLSALLLCTIPVGYVITVKRPSILCGPFAGQSHFYSIITDLVQGHVNKKVMRWLRYITSPGVIFPIILLLILFIFFLFSMVRGLRKANTDLQKQLIHERTEEKRKIFELAGGGSRKKGPHQMGPPPAAGGASTATGQQQQGQGQKGGQRKVPSGQHLPEVERKRRQPWRLFNNINHKGDGRPSLCPSDEPPSSLNSPLSDQSPSTEDVFAAKLSTVGPKPAQQRPTILDYSPSRTSGFRPSLGSLEEGHSVVGSNESHSSDSSTPPHRSVLEQQREHLENVWEKGQQEEEKGSSASTPEEVRNLIAPYQNSPPPQHHLYPPQDIASNSAVSLATFPRDCPPLAILFGTASSLTSSRRSYCTSPMPTRGGVADSSPSPSKSTEMDKKAAQSSANGEEEKLEEYDDLERQSLYDELQSPKATGTAQMERSKATTVSQGRPQPSTRSFSKIYRLRGPVAPLARPESGIGSGQSRLEEVATMPVSQLAGPLRASGQQTKTMKQSMETSFVPPHVAADALTRSDIFPSGSVLLPSGGTPSQEAPHRIALYSREPRRIGIPQPDVDQPRQLSMSPSSEKRRRRERGDQEGGQKEKQVQRISDGGGQPSTSTKTLPGKLADKFVPWPSPDEVRRQRAQLLRPTGFGRSNQPPAGRPLPLATQQELVPPPIFTTGARGRSPPKMIKSVHSSELSPPPEPRRFRITVSPTRAKLGVHQEVEVQDPKSPRRFVIKQQVFTGSTSTFGGSSASGLERIGHLTAAGRRLNSLQQQQQQYLQQAPRVEFGEDDSPRVELPPTQSQQKKQQQHDGNGGRR